MRKGYLLHRGPGNLAQKRSLARAFVVCRHVIETLRKLQAKRHVCSPKKGAGHGHGHLKNYKPENHKEHFFVCRLIFITITKKYLIISTPLDPIFI